MRLPSQTTLRRAVTLTELLVVLVIISLLATIAVPVYVNKAEQARIATARREVREIAQALQQCAIIHGFYVPLQVLDDLHPGVNLASSNYEEDDLENSETGQYRLIDATADPGDEINNQLLIDDNSNNPRVRRLYEEWAGPFLQAQRVYEGEPPIPAVLTQGAVRRDYPLDPWGQPYRLYSPLGLVGNNADETNSSSWDTDSAFNGELTTQDARFDRYAIVSVGSDGGGVGLTIGGLTGNDPEDDIIYLFGGLFFETSFKAFR